MSESATVDNEGVSRASYHRDEGGLVVAWLVRVVLVLGLVALVLFEAGAIAINFITLDGTANEVAAQVSAEAATGADAVPNLKCNRRARVPACQAAYDVAREHGVHVLEASYDQQGVFHVTLRRTADTFIVGRIDAIKDWATATASARAGTN